MPSRREFIRAGTLAVGAMAGAGALVGGEARASQPAGGSGLGGASLPLYAVVFDERIPESVIFADEVRRRGLRTVNLDRGDVTPLWYHDLYHRWKDGPAAIAGLTTSDALFVLETFGNDAGLRLQFKAEHRVYADRVDHRVSGAEAMVRSALRVEHRGSLWASDMGRVIASGNGRFGDRTADLTTDLPAQSLRHDRLLVSWVLAPRARRGAPTIRT